MALRVPLQCQSRKIDVGIARGNDPRDDASRSARHRPALRAMADVEEEVWDRRAAEDRRSVRGHRPQARPVLRTSEITRVRIQLFQAPDQHAQAAGRRVDGSGADFGGARDTYPMPEARDGNPGVFVYHRSTRRAVEADEGKRYRIAPHWLDREPYPDPRERRNGAAAERDDVAIGA